jgi:hypothetical protein
MNPIQFQFDVLKGYEPNASVQSLADGTHLISIANIALPSGWSKASTEVRFITPVGYPIARPDCFWADNDLRLSNGNMPQNTGFNPIPNVSSTHLWFSWHLATWNPNSDNLLTYLNVIRRRLHDPR